MQRLGDRHHVVAHKYDGAPVASHLLHLGQALLLKLRIADSQHFIDDQNFWIKMRSNREGETRLHAAGIALYGRVDESLDAGKIDDLVKFAVDFHPAHAENGTVEKYIFPAAEFGVKSGADLKQRAGSASQANFAGRRGGDLGDDLEKRALAGAVPSDNADDLPLLDSEGDVLQCPERLNVRTAE